MVFYLRRQRYCLLAFGTLVPEFERPRSARPGVESLVALCKKRTKAEVAGATALPERVTSVMSRVIVGARGAVADGPQ